MASSTLSHRGVVESDNAPNVTGALASELGNARNDEAQSSFIAADRARVQELQQQLPTTAATALPVTPAQADRHGIAERLPTGQQQRSMSRPVGRSNKRGPSREPPTVTLSPERPTRQNPFGTAATAEMTTDQAVTALTNCVTELESKHHSKNFQLQQSFNDLEFKLVSGLENMDTRWMTLEKALVDNGIGLVQKISELEMMCVKLSDRLTELTL